MIVADLVAALHAAAVVFLLTGALLALRWPRLVLVHVPVAVGILAVNRAGADCPLTTLELWLRGRSGGEVYGEGFLGHYVFAPLGVDGAGASVQIGMYALAVLSNALGYGLLARRARSRSTGRAGEQPRAAPLRLTAGS